MNKTLTVSNASLDLQISQEESKSFYQMKPEPPAP